MQLVDLALQQAKVDGNFEWLESIVSLQNEEIVVVSVKDSLDELIISFIESGLFNRKKNIATTTNTFGNIGIIHITKSIDDSSINNKEECNCNECNNLDLFNYDDFDDDFDDDSDFFDDDDFDDDFDDDNFDDNNNSLESAFINILKSFLPLKTEEIESKEVTLNIAIKLLEDNRTIKITIDDSIFFLTGIDSIPVLNELNKQYNIHMYIV